jgi:flagellar basal-body rod modification protein FlgD
MTIDPTSGVVWTPVSGAGSSTDVKPTNNASKDLDQDAFLKLLVAQLKYQDPMEPMKGAEFMAQTAQFTSVQKLTEMNTLNNQLLQMQKLSQAGGLVGRTIAYQDALGQEATGVVTAATLTAGNPVLKVGTTDVPLDSVTEVRATAPATS